MYTVYTCQASIGRMAQRQTEYMYIIGRYVWLLHCMSETECYSIEFHIAKMAAIKLFSVAIRSEY